MATVIALIVMSIVVGIVFSSFKQQRDFGKKWPPIDDDEFIRRCPPGVDRTMALRVRAIVAKQLGFKYDQIYPEQNFVDDLYC